MSSSVAVYCGSSMGTRPIFRDAAREMGECLATAGHTLVYGGGNVGLMGVVADAALSRGGRVIGVIPTQLVGLEMAHPGVELEVVDTMAQRKTRMEELSQAFVALPGGMGTMEELTEVLTMQQLGYLDGPVGLLNVEGFWDPWVELMQRMVSQGFLRAKFADALVVESTPADLLKKFSAWNSPGNKWEDV